MSTKITFSILTIFMFCSACGLFGGEDEAHPAIPGKIVFSMPDDSEKENYQIYTMNADGSGIKQLTHFEDQEFVQPSWSPDGEQIVFVTTLRSSSAGGSLYLMDGDGSNMRPLKERPRSLVVTPGSNPAWSPDGKKIAFDWCTNCELGGRNSEIFIYDFETDSVMQITNHPAGDTNPTWSPDGQILAFVSNRDYYDADTLRFRSDLYSINVNRTNLNRITETGYSTIPNWHPKNPLIAYEWNIQGNEIYLFDISSNKVIEITTNLQFETSPQWSYSGEHLVLFGRKSNDHFLEVQFFSYKFNQLKYLESIDDNIYLKEGWNFKWYYNESN